jgi:cyclase
MILPAIDLMDGRCVRLKQGDYNQVTFYPVDPLTMARLIERMGYEWLHIVDLDGARKGESVNAAVIAEIARITSLKLQVGGGLRTMEAIESMFSYGVSRVMLGSVVVHSPQILERALERWGAERIVVAVDVKEGVVRVSGWKEKVGGSLLDFITSLQIKGVKHMLCTDIAQDGMMRGPDFSFYQDLRRQFPDLHWIAAGGIRSLQDVERLNQMGVHDAVMGKAFYQGTPLAKRVIPCLDVDGGRVVKGISFESLRDAGDPVELARYYDAQGADELVFLDITATSDKRTMVADLARRVAQAISIPFTIGGGIRSIEDIRSALEAGADKVSIESAAVLNSELISEASLYFGSQAIVISVSAKRREGGEGWEVYIKGGRERTTWDLIEFLSEMQRRGAGEVLLNSINEDGQGKGYDLDMLRAASEVLKIPLIASSGAGELSHFYDGVVEGKADAVLAASVFHYGKFTVGEVKEYLDENGVPVRGKRAYSSCS